MKIFCESLREHIMKIADFETKNVVPLTLELRELYEKIKSTIAAKKVNLKYTNNKNYNKAKHIVIILVKTKMIHIAYVI